MSYFVAYVYATGETTDEEFDSFDDAIAFADANDGTIYSSEDYSKPIYPR